LNAGGISLLFIELGLVIADVAVASRVSSHFGFSTIPLYLLARIALGKRGLARLPLSRGFIHVGAEIGVRLPLFMLGLEYTGEELKHQLQTGLPAGLVDIVLKFSAGSDCRVPRGMEATRGSSPGWHYYVSSSGVIAKILADGGN
jgi:CPA2 family monovalent cation:H+ antiporter-2